MLLLFILVFVISVLNVMLNRCKYLRLHGHVHLQVYSACIHCFCLIWITRCFFITSRNPKSWICSIHIVGLLMVFFLSKPPWTSSWNLLVIEQRADFLPCSCKSRSWHRALQWKGHLQHFAQLVPFTLHIYFELRP